MALSNSTGEYAYAVIRAISASKLTICLEQVNAKGRSWGPEENATQTAIKSRDAKLSR